MNYILGEHVTLSDNRYLSSNSSCSEKITVMSHTVWTLAGSHTLVTAHARNGWPVGATVCEWSLMSVFTGKVEQVACGLDTY